MENVEYLYKLTLQNYITDKILDDNPIFETLLLNFISKNLIIVNSKDLINKFIVYLHYELDCLFYRLPKKDILPEVNALDRTRLRSNVKKFASSIKTTYLQIFSNT